MAGGVRPPTAAELCERFGGGILGVVGPEPVEGPFVMGPFVVEGEPEPDDSAFVWTFWAGSDLRSVRIETYAKRLVGTLEDLARSWFRALGHDGPVTARVLPVTIDGVPNRFSGESGNDTVVLQQVVDGIPVVVVLEDGWPLDQGLNLARLEGAELDAMLSRSWDHFRGLDHASGGDAGQHEAEAK